jgi:hypothetical protein
MQARNGGADDGGSVGAWLSFGSKSSTGNVPDLSPFRFKWIVPPIDRFWADRSAASMADTTCVRGAGLRSPKGRICGFELDEKGVVGEPVPVLERDYHLSYPYTFEWNGDRFMIPESVANTTVDLYRAVRAPYEWKFERTLLNDVRLVDATVVEIDGRWWMFAGAVSRGGSRRRAEHLLRGLAARALVPAPQKSRRLRR